MTSKQIEQEEPASVPSAIGDALSSPATLAPDDERRLWLPPSARHERYAATFSVAQLKELRRLGVEEEQRVRLVPALRVIRLYSETAPKLSEVRQHLREVARTTREARRALQALLAAPETEGARREAQQRLQQASLRLGPGDTWGGSLDHIAETLDGLLRLTEDAVACTPREQTRAVAHPYPVAYIDTALRIGFNETWKNVSAQYRKPYPFPPSKREGSPFLKVVSLCYSAAGVTTSLRAIQAYLDEVRTAD